jgi:hypothetical protein
MRYHDPINVAIIVKHLPYLRFLYLYFYAPGFSMANSLVE